jgi:hypothetical protein
LFGVGWDQASWELEKWGEDKRPLRRQTSFLKFIGMEKAVKHPVFDHCHLKWVFLIYPFKTALCSGNAKLKIALDF